MYGNASDDINTSERYVVSTNFAETSDYNLDDYQYHEYIYKYFKFEVPIYLYVWEILVIIVSLVNCLVVVVLLDKSMRSQTNMILVALAISDSLTGLVTLPSYIAVFTRCKDEQSLTNDIDLNNSIIRDEKYHTLECALDKQLCEFFMISKFFVSQIFHTISIYLTLFLSCQRYISVKYPFNAQRIFSVRNTVIICVCIFIISPVLHIYQILDDKTSNGLCAWVLNDCSTGGCAYVWVVFSLIYLIPCVVLLMMTGLFIRQLMKGKENLKRMGSKASQISRRRSDNRRLSYVVVAIAVVFLVTEVPYGIFLFTTVVLNINVGHYTLETNRSFQAVYQISLLLSFHANFYIYIFFNQRFRIILQNKFAYPVSNLFRNPKSVLKNSLSMQEYRNTTETRDSCKSSNQLKSIGTLSKNSNEQTVVTQQVTSNFLHNITTSRL